MSDRLPPPPPAPSGRTYPRPAVAVDLVVCTVVPPALKVLLIRRGIPPFQGSWALPGGFVRVGEDEQGEDLDAAAARELEEETGLPPKAVFLEQLYTFGRAGRDPRGRVISVAYYALVRPDLVAQIEAGSDAAEAQWFTWDRLAQEPLAFDHQEILATALTRLRGKLDYTAIAFDLVPPQFTVSELRTVFEAIKGTEYDPGNFQRRFKRMLEDGTLAPVDGKRATGKRPAQLYQFCRRGET